MIVYYYRDKKYVALKAYIHNSVFHREEWKSNR
jgi:hypothetical protein